MFIKNRKNINLYIEKYGEGKNCIYIHGGPGSWSEDFKVYCKDEFSKFCNMIYLDQRGCGRSDGNLDDNYSIDSLVEDIEDIRKDLKINKIVLIAHSFGGIIAVNYAYKYKENVEALILTNCTLNLNDSLQSQVEQGCKLLNIDVDMYKYDELITKWTLVANKLIKDNLYYKLQYMNYSNYKKVKIIDENMVNKNLSKKAFYNEDYFYDYTNLTRSLNVKTLIICGDEDYAIGINHYKDFNFKNKTIKILKSKHNPYVENTKEYISIVREFLESI